MDIEQVREYALSINGVTEDQPFGDDIITFRIEGKIFLCLWLGGGKHDIKGNTEPRFALKLTSMIILHIWEFQGDTSSQVKRHYFKDKRPNTHPQTSDSWS